MIKCAGCSKNKPFDGAYSKKQQNIIREAIAKKGAARANLSNARCMMCTGAQRVEATCSDCDRTLGREEFDKAQLKKEDPKCRECQLKRTEMGTAKDMAARHLSNESYDDEDEDQDV